MDGEDDYGDDCGDDIDYEGDTNDVNGDEEEDDVVCALQHQAQAQATPSSPQEVKEEIRNCDEESQRGTSYLNRKMERGWIRSAPHVTLRRARWPAARLRCGISFFHHALLFSNANE